MRNFQDTFKSRKRSFISALSICMTVPLTPILAGIVQIPQGLNLNSMFKGNIWLSALVLTMTVFIIIFHRF